MQNVFERKTSKMTSKFLTGDWVNAEQDENTIGRAVLRVAEIKSSILDM